jgi:hypothetical protein
MMGISGAQTDGKTVRQVCSSTKTWGLRMDRQHITQIMTPIYETVVSLTMIVEGMSRKKHQQVLLLFRFM